MEWASFDKLKVLLVHNFYGSEAPSGENAVFVAEKELLREHGHHVIELTRHSDEIRGQGVWGKLKGAASTPWNPFSLQKVCALIEHEKPDIMHVNNVFPMLSPAIFYAAKSSKTATILTLHNYRLFCAAAIPLRHGQPCTMCLDERSVLSAMRYGCYRNSRLATLPLAVSIALHRVMGTWEKQIDAFIALSDFQRNTMIKAGLPANKIHIKPHFYANPPNLVANAEREDRVVFVGRLGEEKGVRYLIDAWLEWGDSAPVLELIGEGPLAAEFREKIEKYGKQSKIQMRGQMSFTGTQQRIASSRLLVLPSICFEGFPMVIREAFALGVPVAASRLGSMINLVQDGKNGLLFTAGDADDLLRVVRTAWHDKELLSRIGEYAHTTFDRDYTANTNHEKLMQIYNQACANRRHYLRQKG